MLAKKAKANAPSISTEIGQALDGEVRAWESGRPPKRVGD